MRVVCDNCAASYKIPDSKLTKEVNKATCRKCGHAIYIKRPGDPEPAPAPQQPPGEERTLITSAADLERAVRERLASAAAYDEPDLRPTTVGETARDEATIPRDAAPLAEPARPPHLPMAPPPAETARIDRSRPTAIPTPIPPAPAMPALPVAAPAAPPATDPTRTGAWSSPAAAAAATVAPARPGWPPAAGPAVGAPPAPVAAPPALAAAIAPPVAAPAPPPPYVPTTAAAFDPRGDLLLAMLGAAVGLLGVALLVVAAMVDTVAVLGSGAFLGSMGLLVALLVLLTGGRGTRPASWVGAIVGSFVLSLASTAVAVLLRVALVGEPEAELPVAAATPAPPVAAPAAVPPAAAALEAVAAAEPPPAPPVEAAAPPAPTPVAAPPAPAPTPTPVAAPTPVATRSTPAPRRETTAVEPAPRIAPKATTTSTASRSESTAYRPSSSASSASASTKATASEEAAPAAPKSISPVAIDTMIRTNKAVKGCFIAQKAETGDLPRGVKLKMTIGTSGKVGSAAIAGGEWAGTPFESCLTGAVRSIQFPTFDGDPVSLTYPFQI